MAVKSDRTPFYNHWEVAGWERCGWQKEVMRISSKKIAIKLLHSFRSSEAGMRRFSRERQILAGLNHPGIARLLDGGISDDKQPYYVMEHVDGMPIGRYTQQNKLTIPERLELFKKACEAVKYAHQKLVIHSDIKPEHIMVNAEGQVKLLDFGLARLSEQQNSATQNLQLFSPAYASPEQIVGNLLTTSTDVYSLGVILYELLTGKPPYDLKDRTALQALKVVTETIPQKPSIYDRKIADDLNIICLKALEKQPEERYVSIEAFLDDLQRFMDGLPISAQQKGYSYSYRIRKYVSRNFAATLLTLAAIAALVLTILFYTLQLQQERSAAIEELKRAESLNRFFQELFETDNRRGSYAADFTAKELVDIGARRIENELRDQPEERLNLMLLIGRVYRLLGVIDEGRELQQKSLSLAMKHYDAGHQLIAQSQRALAIALRYSGKHKAADSLMTLAYKVLSDSSRPEYSRMLHRSVLNDYGIIKRFLKRFDESINLYKLSMQMAVEEDDPRELLTSMNNLAEVYRRTNKLESAESLFVLIIPKLKENYGDDHPYVAKSLNNLGLTYRRPGKVDESILALEESLVLREKLYGMEHPELCAVLNNLGGAYTARDKKEEAL
ncbi:MAG: serine/threonine-protein kinase, partial [Calditrichota bacterium]